MDKLIEILGISVLGVMIASWYTPIQRPKRWLIHQTRYLSSILNKGLDTALNCSKCTSFILFLVISHGDVIGAALCSFMGYLIGFYIDKIQTWYEG